MAQNTKNTNAPIGVNTRHLSRLIALLAPLLITGCGDAQFEPASQSDRDERLSRIEFSTPQEGIWPPRARNVSDFQPFDANTGQISMQGDISTAFGANNEVASTLGDGYSRFFTTVDRQQKNAPLQLVREEFYNYDTDQTIQISQLGSNPLKIDERAAIHYQPPENRLERVTAIQLARAALLASGFTDLDHLSGTAMLAYPSEREMAETGSQFYPERMLYVTFGPGNGQMPVFSALVNLSQEAVVHSGLVH